MYRLLLCRRLGGWEFAGRNCAKLLEAGAALEAQYYRGAGDLLRFPCKKGRKFRFPTSS